MNTKQIKRSNKNIRMDQNQTSKKIFKTYEDALVVVIKNIPSAGWIISTINMRKPQRKKDKSLLGICIGIETRNYPSIHIEILKVSIVSYL